VSGPARPKPALGRTARPQKARPSTAQGVLPGLTGVSVTRLLNRLIAGKAWIAIVAFALIGIVTLQLALLELNAGIGRAIVRAGSLQREDAALNIEDAELTSGARIETQASKLGMQIIPAGEERFLSAPSRSATARAAHVLSQPAQTAPAVSSSATESAPSSSQTESASAGTSSGGEAQSSSASAAGSGTEAATSTGTGEAQTGAGVGTGPATGTPAGGSQSEVGAAAATASSGAASATTAGAGEATPAGGTQPAPAG
jgi:cell division protein FtsL